MHFPFCRKPMESPMDPTAVAAACSPMFALVCVNNVNRSTAAHAALAAEGLRACSFGCGRRVTFPGRTAAVGRSFRFMTPYETMLRLMRAEDPQLVERNGVREILERDLALKRAPERWQSLTNKQLDAIDVVVCLDYSVFLAVLEDIRMRVRLTWKRKRLHVICLETEDTPEHADAGSARAVELCSQLNAPPAELTEARVKAVVEQFEARHALQMFYLGLEF